VTYGNSKRVLVIKGIKSSIIEQAIIFLKDDIELDTTRKPSKNNKFIIIEAEKIIENYIKNLSKIKKGNLGIVDKMSKDKLNFIINLTLFSSAILFVFLILNII
jgi:hypothetical protein